MKFVILLKSSQLLNFFIGFSVSKQSLYGLILKNKKNRSSRREVFCKKGVLRNFANFTVKLHRQSLFFNKVAGLRWMLLEKAMNAKLSGYLCYSDHLLVRSTKRIC